MSTAAKMFKFACQKSELQLHITLQCGQSFRWCEVSPGQWRGVLGHKVWTLSQDDTHIFYQIHPSSSVACSPESEEGITHTPKPKRKRVPNSKATINNKLLRNCVNRVNVCQDEEENVSEEKTEAVLRDYFQLHLSLEEMYKNWRAADSNFCVVCPEFPGVRMLNQDPVENVFSFICSSNNNIQRISQLVERLCHLYGSRIVTLDGTDWYTFPTVSSLAADGVEGTLRAQGFGYRAKFIHKSAQMIMERGGEAWLHSLRSLSYEECHLKLMNLHGIGAKVADCICLMSMGHLNAIPVDTHVFQIAARDYLPHLRSCKTVTNKVYREIADHFRVVFGDYAGWAHSVLFSADLKKFQNLKTRNKSPKKQKTKNTKKLCA